MILLGFGWAESKLTINYANGTFDQYESAHIYFTEEEPIFPEVFEHSVIYVEDLSPLLVDKSYMTSTNFTGLVVLTPTIAPPAPYARILQYRGAAALIFGYELLDVPGRTIANPDGEDGSDITLPVVEIGYTSYLTIVSAIKKNTSFNVTIDAEEGNVWIQYWIGYKFDIIFSIVVGIPAVLAAAMAVYKLHVLIAVNNGCNLNVGTACLVCHLIASILRAFFVIVDPMGFRRMLTYHLNNTLFTLPFPFIISGTLVLCFYWFETMSKSSMMVYPFLNRLKIPFFIISGVVIVMDITLSIMRSSGQIISTQLIVVTLICYSALAFGISVFYLVVAIKLLRRIRSSTVTKMKNLKRITKLILVSVSCYGVVLLSLLLFARPTVGGTPLGWFFINMILFLSMLAVSICHILVFEPRAHRNPHSSVEMRQSG
jgi:hypothetical protein